ncbi:beta-hexosaminidase subunit beta-like isoform X2 [Anneissia japonica]|uniref:beta-hexosaminidase subunit beta-like isoform X2 n=1 Tax=Anneissia japonica TaxID=1529436 RepID=UPI001425BA0F|nr:beta-hexosaminidase subunit beta-like isoform X2 [Anneissia japonica]
MSCFKANKLAVVFLFGCILLDEHVFSKPYDDTINNFRNIQEVIRQNQDRIPEGLGLDDLMTAHGQNGGVGTLDPTRGAPWPLPRELKTTNDVLILVKPESFKFTFDSKNCDLLQTAFTRYYNVIFYGTQETPQVIKKQAYPWRSPTANETSLSSLIVTMETCPEYPTLSSNENYTISIAVGNARLKAESIWGVLRGLETFSQIIYESSDGGLAVNVTTITDYPRFAHRGLLLDTSRHFIELPTLLANLDAMAYNKFNVFHWHIVDDQSFPYQSSKFPELSNEGAYDQRHIYTQDDVSLVIAYARERGIRVVPEYDTPGHSQSWGSIKDLLTPCYKDGKPTGTFGPINPTLNSTYVFLKDFFAEVVAKYADHYIHMGGDEVSFDCWKSNSAITAFMKEKGFNDDYAKLEEYYLQNLLEIMSELKAGYMVWQEVIDNGVKIGDDIIVHVWKTKYQNEIAKITAKGYRTLVSSPWYLNRLLNMFSQDWKTFYKVDPQNFNGTAAQKSLVIGGEACMWAEYVDTTNIIQRFWPRASAVGERLWSSKDLTDANAATGRLAEHRCRMVRRGIQAEPVTGPGFCSYEWHSRSHQYLP